MIHRQGAAFDDDLPRSVVFHDAVDHGVQCADVGQRRDERVRVGGDFRDRGRRIETGVRQGRHAIGVQVETPYLELFTEQEPCDIAAHGAEAEDADILGKLDPAENEIVRLTDAERAVFKSAVGPLLTEQRKILGDELFAHVE